MKKLIWLTDLHLVEPDQDWPQGVDPLSRLRVCLDEVRALHSDAERIVVSGDLVQLRNPGAYSILRAELERLPMPYRLLVGNHDDRGALISTFPEINRVEGFIQGADNLDGARLLYLERWLPTANIMASYARRGRDGSATRLCPPMTDHCSSFCTIRHATSACQRSIA